MAKEHLLNYAFNRWGLNKKSSVGPLVAWVRECAPKTLEEWRECYLKHLEGFLRAKGVDLSPDEYLDSLGDRLYAKLQEVIKSELEEITLEDCRSYVWEVVVNRTFQGYLREMTSVKDLLESLLEVEIEPAPDYIDRGYDVDYVIPVGDKYIGLQIKPVTYEQMPDAYKWVELMQEKHKRFWREFGGKVFIVFSKPKGKREFEVENLEDLVKDIEQEVRRLREGNSSRS